MSTNLEQEEKQQHEEKEEDHHREPKRQKTEEDDNEKEAQLEYPRCQSMKDGEPTAADVLREFLSSVKPVPISKMHDYLKTIDLLLSSITQTWGCHHCQYWKGKDGYKDAYTETHDLTSLLFNINAFHQTSNIKSFCETFLVEKCGRDERQKHKHYNVVSELLDFLHAKNYIPKDRKDALQNHIDHCRSVNGEKIRKAIQDLNSRNYWDGLEEDIGKNDHQMFKYNSTMGLCMKEVTDDGWLFKLCDFEMTRPMNSFPLHMFPRVGNDRCILLRLPRDVAKLGRADMSICDTGLQYKNGVWRPYAINECNDDACIVGDVYPYCFF